jgi:hypothetical protein
MDARSRGISLSGLVAIVALSACGGDAADSREEQAGATREALRNTGPNPVTGVPGGIGVPPPPPPPDPCASAFPIIESFTATPSEIALGDSTTLSWQVHLPNNGCSYRVELDGQQVAAQGTFAVQPVASTGHTLAVWHLSRATSWSWSIATSGAVQVTVDLPQDPNDPARKVVTIASQQMVPTFVQALGTANTTVMVNADLDLTGLTGLGPIEITNGVVLKGWRSAAGQPFQSGPLLSVTDVPSPLFEIDGDNVEVTGVRFQGPSMVADATLALAMLISDVMPNCGGAPSPLPPDPNACGTIPGHVNVQIDNNEFSGWTDTAVAVSDLMQRIAVPVAPVIGATGAELDYSPYQTTEPVWIHDNFFHHNLHSGTEGYGIDVGLGAHALIERNVFDNNRHAITSGHNDPRVGYRAYRNLVLPEHGTGEQQFDIHGSDPCGTHVFDTSYWCGLAGHDFDFLYNSFLYKDNVAIMLRGIPSLALPDESVIVRFNVFAHGSETDAVHWTEVRPTIQDNLTDRTSYDQTQTCDFDGDGINDTFEATGQTLWYCPGQSQTGCVTAPGSGQPTWVYLNQSQKPLSALSLGRFSGHSVCDVVDNGWISVGGTGPWIPLVPLTGPSTGPLAGTVSTTPLAASP